MSEAEYKWVKIYDTIAALESNAPYKKAFSLSVRGKDICIVHGLDGFYGVQEKCPHNGYPLSRGNCSDENSIVCPMHRYHFDLKTGRAKSGIGETLLTYPIKIDDTGVYLGFKIKKAWSLW